MAQRDGARAVVVGGGMAGLVAARTLAARGLQVTLLERSGACGGSVQSRELGGFRLDSGAESFSTRSGTVPALAADLGLADRIVAPEAGGAWVQLPGRQLARTALRLPATGIFGIPADPTDPAVAAAVGRSGALRASLDRVLPVGSLATRPGVSLGELVRTRMGPGVLAKLVAPVTNGVLSANPEDLDADAVAPGLRAAVAKHGSLGAAVSALRNAAPAGSAVGGLRGGMALLTHALVAELQQAGVDLRLNESAVRVDLGAHGWTTETEHSTLRRGLDSAGLLVATDGPAAIDLLQQVFPALADERPAEGPGVALVTLLVDVPELDASPRGTGVLVANGVAGVEAKALTHATAKWAWLREETGPGCHILRLSYGRAGDTSSATGPGTSDARLFRHALRDASALLGVPVAAADVLDWDVVRWTGTLPHAAVGHSERVKRIREVIAAAPGLEVTGAWLAGTGLVSVIDDARERATALAERMGCPPIA